MPTSKAPNRFVPTLTEVVHPGRDAPRPVVDPQRLVEQVLQSIRPKLEQQLRAALHALVEEQIRLATPRLQQDIEDAVIAAVAQALARKTPPKT